MMKKTLLAFIVGAFMLSSSNVSAQALEEGNVDIDLYYGFPNLYTSVLRSLYENSGTQEDFKIGGIGPLGIRAEYMLADKIGLGIDFGFNNSKVTYSAPTSVWNATTSSYDDITYDYTIKTTKIGVMVTFNYHFIDNDQVDFYGVIGAGYKNRNWGYESTDPNWTDETVITTLIPVAGRVGVGVRYFFTDNIGINIAAGFGQGGIINGGVSFKF